MSKIYLPTLPAETEPVVAPGTETILLVEDEDAVRKLAGRTLRKHGYNVFEAPAPDEAIRIASEYQGPLHLLLTDVMMPGMRGTELAKVLSVARPDMAVLFMSGYAEASFADYGAFGPGAAYMQKPFTAAELAEKIREMLEKNKASKGSGVPLTRTAAR